MRQKKLTQFQKATNFLKLYLWQWWRIPAGSYCRKVKVCPYWDCIEDWPAQADGYCHFLGWGDMDKNNDDTVILTNVKTGEKIKAAEMPFGVSLLWDQVKECSVKPYNWKERKIYKKHINVSENCEDIEIDESWAKAARKSIKNWAKENPY